MSSRPNAFDWNQMRAFLATVEAGSLSAASRALGLTQPTLSRQISGLEADLGVVLFERVGRRLVLTASGRELAAHVKAMGAAADRISIAAAAQSDAVEGLVRITAIDIVAAHVLPAALKRLNAAAPGIEIQIIASNTIDDLLRREADIAIRHVRPEEPDLVARRCPDSHIQIHAATAFLDGHGRPKRPEDLADAPFIGFERDGGLVRELRSRGVPITQQNFRWTCASTLVELELIRQGMGFGVTFGKIARQFRELECVLPQLPPIVAPVWLVAHRELHASRRLRLVFDVLAEVLTEWAGA
jgi:DNA-binding transcriptional LysR family regulator